MEQSKSILSPTLTRKFVQGKRSIRSILVDLDPAFPSINYLWKNMLIVEEQLVQATES